MEKERTLSLIFTQHHIRLKLLFIFLSLSHCSQVYSPFLPSSFNIVTESYQSTIIIFGITDYCCHLMEAMVHSTNYNGKKYWETSFWCPIYIVQYTVVWWTLDKFSYEESLHRIIYPHTSYLFLHPLAVWWELSFFCRSYTSLSSGEEASICSVINYLPVWYKMSQWKPVAFSMEKQTFHRTRKLQCHVVTGADFLSYTTCG